MNRPPSDQVKAVLRGVLAIAIFWLAALLLSRLGQYVFGGWAANEVGRVLACALGVFLALRLRVKLVAYVLAGQLAFCASELLLHSIFGVRSVQGGATHFAVMLAGILGVVLGWYLSRRQTSEPEPHSAVRSSSNPPSEIVTPQELANNVA